ncbi:hypothetical protein D9601_11845 [Sphingomonas sp. MA1305]|nr:hypothetical protein [Sphingomonas sp. MA1305]
MRSAICGRRWSRHRSRTSWRRSTGARSIDPPAPSCAIVVIPAKAGIQKRPGCDSLRALRVWIPACAGMTSS